jgi:hypothetical protein
VSYSLGNKDVMLIELESTGHLEPGFERTHKHTVVVSKNGVEIRQYERFGMGNNKYAIHTESVPAPLGSTIDYPLFCKTFKRQWFADPLDVRKAVRMALKVSPSQD